MNEFEKLVSLFRKLPGIGTRQAQRFAHYVVRQNNNFAKELALALEAAKDSAGFCARCYRLIFNEKQNDTDGLCSICSSPTRDQSTIMIVEKDADLNHLEKTGLFDGVYFVLGGVLPMQEEKSESFIRLKQLKETLGFYLDEDLKEVVLGLSLTPEGEFTGQYLTKEIEALSTNKQVKISSLGRGLSVGSELEYSDTETLRYALNSRK